MVAARMPTSRWIRQRRPALALVAALSFSIASCSEKTEVIVGLDQTSNQPPTIVAQGPTWPSTAIDLNHQPAPAPYVIVGDPNGLDDIALAVFSAESAVLRRIVVRPDSVVPGNACSFMDWSDSIDITGLLPASLGSGAEDCIMLRSGSAFTYTGFGIPYYFVDCRAFPEISTASPYFGAPGNPCGPGSLSRFSVNPPAIPAAMDVNVTYVDVEFRGLRVTVYDGAGETATTTFPNLRLIHRAYGERVSPP